MLIIIIHFVHRVQGLNLDPCCWGLGIHMVLAKMLFRTKGSRAGAAGEQMGWDQRSHPILAFPTFSSLENFALLWTPGFL